MKKYLFLTIIFAVNHAGRRKAQISTEKPHTSSINNLPKTSLDTKEKIRKLKEQNKNLLMTLDTLKDKIANIENLEKQNKDLMEIIKDMNQDVEILMIQMLHVDKQTLIIQEELIPTYRELKAENEQIKTVLARYGLISRFSYI